MRNYFYVSDGLVFIQLNKNDGTVLYTTVSENKLELLLNIDVKWCVLDQGRAFPYVSCVRHLGNGNKETLRIHRVVTQAGEGDYVNHIDGDGLNNTDDNLEIVTNQVNSIKRVFRNSNNTSGVRGVSFDKSRNKWQVKFKKNYKTYHFGRYETLDQAEIVAAEEFNKLFKEELR